MKAMPHTVWAFFLILLPAFCSPVSGGEQPTQNAIRREQIKADWLLLERVQGWEVLLGVAPPTAAWDRPLEALEELLLRESPTLGVRRHASRRQLTIHVGA